MPRSATLFNQKCQQVATLPLEPLQVGPASQQKGTAVAREDRVRTGPAVPADVTREAALNALSSEFEELGLSRSEARVTAALLQLGSAKSAELARAAGIPRTNIYQVIESLRDKGLAVRVPGPGTAVWTSPGRDKVLERLDASLTAAQEERLRQHRLRTQRLREMLADSVPDNPPEPVPYVTLLTCPPQVRDAHERLLNQAATEVLVFNRPPYSAVARSTHVAALESLGRGVAMRVLYQAAQVDDPEADAFRESVDAYRDAGVDGRVVDELPIKVVVVDREATMLAMDDPLLPDGGFPVTMLIEHKGFAAFAAAAFDKLWDVARPYAAGRFGGAGVDGDGTTG
jgi:sugar-specific transcriptional regulator TrmB